MNCPCSTRPSTATAFALNRTARDVWALADGTSTVEQVVATLARFYRVVPETIAHDVHEVLVALTEAGLLAPASA